MERRITSYNVCYTKLLRLLKPLDHRDTTLCVSAERALSRTLSGSCNVPLGAYAELSGRQLRLRAFVGAPDGSRMIAGERTGSTADAETVITSYSIHYTKLYDCTGRGALLPLQTHQQTDAHCNGDGLDLFGGNSEFRVHADILRGEDR